MNTENVQIRHRILQIFNIEVKQLQSQCIPLNLRLFTLYFTHAPWCCIMLCETHMLKMTAAQVKHHVSFCHTFPQINIKVLICTTNLWG